MSHNNNISGRFLLSFLNKKFQHFVIAAKTKKIEIGENE